MDPRSSKRRTKENSSEIDDGAEEYDDEDDDRDEDEDADDDDVAIVSVSATVVPISDFRIIWLISLMPTVRHLFLSTDPGKFLQLLHLHRSEHTIPS